MLEPLKPVSRASRIVLGAAFFLMFFAAWALATFGGLVDGMFLKDPVYTLKIGWDLFAEFGFIRDVGVTVWRVVGGLGVGAASVIAPAYIAEVSPAHVRGRLGSLQQLAIVTGIVVSLAVDALLSRLAGGAREDLWMGLEGWRWMFIVMAVPAISAHHRYRLSWTAPPL